MKKRAAIYVRVSSERQADQVSPEVQERDCRDWCERKGYALVGVYKDTERYRVGRRLVEPSGTRADRPALRAMLAAADAGNLDLIIAWREDRLYRSFRPMLEVLECLERNSLGVELTNDSFDARFAPIKAWAAKMELDAKHERLLMGVAGRFERGRDWNGFTLFGYQRVDGLYLVEESEAEWVRRAFRWFAEGWSVRDIRKQFLAGAVPQRNPSKHSWAIRRLYKLLKNETYHTGITKRLWNDTEFELTLPVIVDQETAARVRARFESYKAYPAGNQKAEALGAGLVYCQHCGARMQVVRIGRGRADGKYVYTYYRCPTYVIVGSADSDCALNVRTSRIDDEIWAKVWEVAAVPGRLEALLEARIAQLRHQEQGAHAEEERTTDRLGALTMERQKVITAWRKGRIQDSDYDLQMGALNAEQVELERELAQTRLLASGQVEKLETFANWYRENVAAGLEGLNDPPLNAEDARRKFVVRRRFVESLVRRVAIKADKSVTVDAEFDLASFLHISVPATPCECFL